MRKQTILPVIFILAFSVYSQDDLVLKHHGNVDFDAMHFEATHVSEQQCDRTNYQQGRAFAWDGVAVSYHKVDGTTGATVSITATQAADNTPSWISQVQQEAIKYSAERQNREKRYEEKLSEYSSTEKSIAEFLGKEPWEIDRQQLKRWAQEADKDRKQQVATNQHE